MWTLSDPNKLKSINIPYLSCQDYKKSFGKELQCICALLQTGSAIGGCAITVTVRLNCADAGDGNISLFMQKIKHKLEATILQPVNVVVF